MTDTHKKEEDKFLKTHVHESDERRQDSIMENRARATFRTISL